MSDTQAYDVIIIGGGPAGCSAGALLAESGRRVLILEREKFPRYHVGESMIPFTNLPIQRLGLREKMELSAYVRKHSVQFVAPNGATSQPFYFSTRYEDDIAQTWQVLRSEFDEMLMDHAQERGATVLEETRVTQLLEENGQVVGVRAQAKDRSETEYRAPITLDCTGKESFAAHKLRWRQKDPFLNKVAVWTYFKGAKRDPGIDEGATTVAFIPEKGWFWYIPLHDDRVSVGVVAEGKYLTRDGERDLERLFMREVENNAWIKEYISQGERDAAFRITNEYSYHSQHCYKNGLLLVGDAFAFLDPVFSSGLMLALKSGVMAADAVENALQAQNFAPEQFANYGAQLREGIENMRKLVYAFYAPDFSFAKLTKAYPEIAPLVTDCLSGDVNKDFSEMFAKVAEFAEIPEELHVGSPEKLDLSHG